MQNYLNKEGDATEAVSPDIEIPEAPTNIEEEEIVQPLPEILGHPKPSQQTQHQPQLLPAAQSTKATSVVKTQDKGGVG